MAEKISVQIALEGGKEVEQQLAAIGKAGDQAFAGLNEAGTTAAEGIAKAGEASQTTAKQTDKASESTSKLTLANVALVAAIAESTAGFAEHAVGIVQAVRHHETLIQSLLKLVSGANTATKALGLIAPELAVVGAGALAIAGPIATAVTAFEALEKVVTKLAASDEKLNQTLQTLAATSGESFDKLQRGEAAFGQIGIKAETFRSTIAKINETLAGTDVTGLTKGMKDIVALVNQIAAGDKKITFADWVTAEDKVRGVSIAMKQAADAGKNATQVLLEFLRSADLATSLKVGAAFGLSEADVDRVRRFSGSISDLIQRIQGAPVLIGPEAAANLERMRNATQAVDSAWVRLKQSVTSTDFPSIAASFSATMNEMKASALNGAAAISESLGQAFRGMSNQAKSDVGAIGAAFKEIGITDAFKGFATQFNQELAGANAALATFVGNFLQSMGGSAEKIKIVQDSINGVTQATQTAGQAAQEGVQIWTQWGTAAEGSANTAKAGVQEGVQIWTQWGTAASQAGEKAAASFDKTGTAAQSGSDKVAAFASQIAGITWDAISSAGVAAWNAITSAIQAAYNWLLQYIGLQQKTPAPKTGGGAPAPAAASGGLLFGRGSGTSDSNLAWVSRGEYIMPARAVAQPGVLSFLEALRRGGGIPGFAGGGVVDGGGGGVSNFLQAFNKQTELINSMSNEVSSIGQEIVALESYIGQTNKDCAKHSKDLGNKMDVSADIFSEALLKVLWKLDTLDPTPGNARGGLLGGRGSGTSDSNLAWVSRGEHIMPARAVAQPGVLAFLEALRRSGGNLGRVLDGMGRFALGGMVRGPMPAFAAGGLAGGMSNVTIQFPGLPAIGGLRASSDVVDQLHKAAALAQVRSGGRKPSRYS